MRLLPRPTHLREPRFAPPLQAELTLGSRWEGPTVGEFVERVEREFGAAPDLTRLLGEGLLDTESLAPAEVRELCDQLGVPAEDFGVEP